MQWKDIKSVEQLKALGKLKEVSVTIQAQFPNQQVPKNSWDKLLQFLLAKTQESEEVEKSWHDITSLEELKGLGTFKEVRDQIFKEAGQIKLSRQSWDALWRAIQDKKTIKESIPCNQESIYFKDKACEIIFYLLELEGEIRLKKLSVNNRHYKDKDWANNWKKEIIKLIHPDQSTHPMAETATKELNKLYEGMIKFGK